MQRIASKSGKRRMASLERLQNRSSRVPNRLSQGILAQALLRADGRAGCYEYLLLKQSKAERY